MVTEHRYAEHNLYKLFNIYKFFIKFLKNFILLFSIIFNNYNKILLCKIKFNDIYLIKINSEIYCYLFIEF